MSQVEKISHLNDDDELPTAEEMLANLEKYEKLRKQRNEANLRYSKKHPEKMNERNRRYYAKHKELILAKAQIKYHENEAYKEAKKANVLAQYHLKQAKTETPNI